MATLSRTGLSPSAARLSRRLPLTSLLPPCRPYNPARASTHTVWAGPLSLAATRGVTLVFLSSGYLDVSVRRVRPRQQTGAMPTHGGLPHSGTRGSKAARASPRNIAACRALHRLREPQASPVRPRSLVPAPAQPHRARQNRTRLVSLLSIISLSSQHVNEPAARKQPRPSWRMWGSNPRPPACKAGALAN